MATQTYNVHEAKAHLSRLLKEVAGGAKVIIAKAGKPAALLLRVEESKSQVRFGVLKGKVKVAEDFDAPLPDTVLAEFEGGGCGC
jgi:prevent-host-death family protein